MRDRQLYDDAEPRVSVHEWLERRSMMRDRTCARVAEAARTVGAEWVASRRHGLLRTQHTGLIRDRYLAVSGRAAASPSCPRRSVPRTAP